MIEDRLRPILASLTEQTEAAARAFLGVETTEEGIARIRELNAAGFDVVMETDSVPITEDTGTCRTFRIEQTVRFRLARRQAA